MKFVVYLVCKFPRCLDSYRLTELGMSGGSKTAQITQVISGHAENKKLEDAFRNDQLTRLALADDFGTFQAPFPWILKWTKEDQRHLSEGLKSQPPSTNLVNLVGIIIQPRGISIHQPALPGHRSRSHLFLDGTSGKR